MSENPVDTITDFWLTGPFCWNCEFMEPDKLDPDVPVYFCSPPCRLEFESQQPLHNFLSKRLLGKRRTGTG